MLLDPYHSVVNGSVRISARQASHFAKAVAGDYNPIHDAGARRFCVPGDLLFALVLARYGLAARMTFTFRGMLGSDVPLHFPAAPGAAFEITDASGRPYLHVERAGAVTTDPAVVAAITRRYVAFSGRNFPDILQPLMAEQNVMFNPARPLVIYDSMGFELDSLDVRDPAMELTGSRLDIAGKRGDVLLDFRIGATGEAIGTGIKKLVVSGLREYDAARMREFVAEFHRRRGAATHI